MALANGTRLGPYEILSPIGSGGMGEVYRASDTRLHRTVALKVSTGPFNERFEREARAIAALNHPNICQIYDVGPDYLVMEYIDGQPLKGPLPLEQALAYAAKICDALDAAHRSSVTHRDLKPANILVSKGGIKLLDFGLAKFQPAVSLNEDTLTTALTGKGQILGTLHYMSPEQLQGREADARSDIFAFGLVLFEMLTGKRAFDGESPASVIAAILERGTPSVTPAAPLAVDRVLRRCLAKDPDDRWQSVRDLKTALEWAGESSNAVNVGPTARRTWLDSSGWIAAVAILATVALLALWRPWTPSTGDPVRFSIYPPEGGTFTDSPYTTVPVPQFALAPDGRKLVYAATVGNKQMLWLRRTDDVVARPITGSENGTSPFWSPDGQWLGFVAEDNLKKIPAEGGHAQVLASGVTDPRGGAWGASDTILFGNGNGGILRVSGTGGPVTHITELDASHGEGTHRWPQFLSDGVRFFYEVRSGRAETQGVYLGTPDGKPKRLLASGDSSALYSAAGFVLWIDGDTMLGQTFDASRMELSGQPFVVAEKAARSSMGEAAISVSKSGATLAYAGANLRRGRLTWFDRSGKSLDSPTPEGDFSEFRLSPDYTRLAATLVDPKTSNPAIWLTDLTRGGTSRLTLGSAFNAAPVWSPDGTSLVFRTTRNGVVEFYRKSASLGGEEVPVLTAETQREAGPSVSAMLTDWSSDNRYLVYSTPSAQGSQIWLLPDPASSQGSTKPLKFLSSSATLMHANFSPNGRLLAYSSNETGTYQVYVQTVPISDRKWLVSTTSGYEPRWRADGREIYYLTEDRKLMAVPVAEGPSFGLPKALFQTSTPVGLNAFRTHYVPARDGQRFLINTQVGDSAPNSITVVLNWTAGLQK